MDCDHQETIEGVKRIAAAAISWRKTKTVPPAASVASSANATAFRSRLAGWPSAVFFKYRENAAIIPKEYRPEIPRFQ